MSKDINVTIKRLLAISKEIIDDFEVLATLSYRDLDKSPLFFAEVANIKKLLNTEDVILNNLTSDEIKKIYHILPTFDDATAAYERTSINVESKLVNILDNDFKEELVQNAEVSYEDINDEDDYYLESTEDEKDELAYHNYITIYTLKNIKARIEQTEADNRNDTKYKQRLLNELKIYKYTVFAQSNFLEKIGVNHNFDIDKIDYLTRPDGDFSAFAFNQCVVILANLYHPILTDDNVSDTIAILFNMMRFESYLANVNHERLESLLNVCEKLENVSKNKFYGSFAKTKLLNKN